MNDEMQKQLADYLATIATAAKTGGAFVIEQAPLIVQEKLSYGRIMEPAQLLLFLAITAGSVWLFRWGLQHQHKWRQTANAELGYAAMGIGIILAVVFSICSCIQTGYVISVWFAPRLYIIEWVAGLLKH